MILVQISLIQNDHRLGREVPLVGPVGPKLDHPLGILMTVRHVRSCLVPVVHTDAPAEPKPRLLEFPLQIRLCAVYIVLCRQPLF